MSSYVTVQVEGHVTPGLENVASDVLQAFMEISVSRVRQKVALMQYNGKHKTQFLSSAKFNSMALSCGYIGSFWIHEVHGPAN